MVDEPPPPPLGGPPPPPDAPPPGYGQVPPPPLAPPPPPPPGYGGPPGATAYGVHGSGYEPRTEGSAVGALVVAIVGIFVCGIVTGIVALVMARNAQQKIDASGGRLTGTGFVTAARIIAVLSIVLSVVSIVIYTNR